MRVLAEMRTVLAFLNGVGCAATELAERLAPARTVYGLGFLSRGAESGVKTYTVTDLTEAAFLPLVTGLKLEWPRPGFISHRVLGAAMLDEMKVYLPDLPLALLHGATPRWREILSFAAAVFGRSEGTLGIAVHPGASPEVKLYIERLGAVRNDFSAR